MLQLKTLLNTFFSSSSFLHSTLNRSFHSSLFSSPTLFLSLCFISNLLSFLYSFLPHLSLSHTHKMPFSLFPLLPTTSSLLYFYLSICFFSLPHHTITTSLSPSPLSLLTNLAFRSPLSLLLHPSLNSVFLLSFSHPLSLSLPIYLFFSLFICLSIYLSLIALLLVVVLPHTLSLSLITSPIFYSPIFPPVPLNPFISLSSHLLLLSFKSIHNNQLSPSYSSLTLLSLSLCQL